MKPPPSTARADALVPVGAWIRLDLPDGSTVIGFTYVDQSAGFSAQGWSVEGTALDQSARTIVRMAMTRFPWRRLEPDEVRAFGLESPPSWVAESYGPQPAAGGLWGLWREHPKLKGHFLPDYADDLQVFVHDGGPRITGNGPEAVWVRVTGMDDEVFRGRVLNQPHHLSSVRRGSEIKFITADGAEFPVMVTDKYLAERGAWSIHPCQQCGLSELFDAPSDLLKVVFPNAPAGQMAMFTALCPLCGGVQGVESKDHPTPGGKVAAPAPRLDQRPWWRFWR